jgi:hypothetical protein
MVGMVDLEENGLETGVSRRMVHFPCELVEDIVRILMSLDQQRGMEQHGLPAIDDNSGTGFTGMYADGLVLHGEEFG